jgi:hypothetical protein
MRVAMPATRSDADLAFAHALTPCAHDFDCDSCPFAATCV